MVREVWYQLDHSTALIQRVKVIRSTAEDLFLPIDYGVEAKVPKHSAANAYYPSHEEAVDAACRVIRRKLDYAQAEAKKYQDQLDALQFVSPRFRLHDAMEKAGTL